MPLNTIFEIGKIVSQDKDALDTQIKNIKLNEKQQQQQNYNLKIIFDLQKQRILISQNNLSEYKPSDLKTYRYCGNNSARDKQYLLTREASTGLKYFAGKMLVHLKLKIIELGLNKPDNRLFDLVEKLLNSSLYNLKKQSINLSKFVAENDQLVQIENPEKGLSELDLKKALFGTGRKHIAGKNLILAIPCCLTEAGEMIVLPEMPEYKELLLARLNVNEAKTSKDNSSPTLCYVCRKNIAATSKHLSKFPRDDISKIFITDKTNYAPYFNKHAYDKNYKFCESCRDTLLIAEKFIRANLSIQLAGISTYILPSFIVSDLPIDYQNGIYLIKKRVELAFNAETLNSFIDSLKGDLYFLGAEVPINLNFLAFESDGNSIKVVTYIRDIAECKFIQVIQIFKEEHAKLRDQIKYFNLNSIYHLIPLKFTKDGKIADKKNRVLDFYNYLFKRLPVSSQLICQYFCEALYHNYYKQRSQFKNIYYPRDDNFDYSIYHYVFNYLILINSLKRLHLYIEDLIMENQKISKQPAIDEKLHFLSEQGFNEQQKALFYLGILIQQVAYSQSKAGHRNKPILNKINYQGMTHKDIQRLYLDVFEKLVQYEQIQYPSVEQDNSRFKELFDRNFSQWKLSDEQNVFYLLSGYAFKLIKRTQNDK